MVAAAIALWAGCGEEESQAVRVSSIDRTEFAEKVEAICEHGRLAALRLQPSAEGGLSERDAMAAAIDATLLPAMQRVIDEIYSVGAPRAEVSRAEALLTALQKAVDAAEDLDVPTLESIEKLLSRPGDLAREARLESCVYG